MKLGAFVNILESDRHSWARQFDFVDQLPGIGHVELWVETLPSVLDIKWLTKRIRDSGLSVLIHAPFVGVSLASHVPELRAASVSRIIAAARFGESLEASVITCHSGPVGIWVDQSTGLDMLAGSLEKVVDSTSITVAIENMPSRSGGSRELVTSVQDLEYLVQHTRGLAVTLDVGHCIQNGEDPARAIENTAAYLKNVHLHDGFKNGPAHNRIGVGELNLDSVLGTLESVYGGYVSLETVGEADTRQSLELVARSKCLSGSSVLPVQSV